MYRLSYRGQDHPRIHGEHCSKFLFLPLNAGSPPHTRGTRQSRHHRRHVVRITPAYTGNTRLDSGNSTPLEDHPRIHGEHLKATGEPHGMTGSPPHTRGTPKYDYKIIEAIGITPAYTGNTEIRQHVAR